MAPYTSMNVDFAYENYYAEGSYFAVNVFMKEIEDYHGLTATLDHSIMFQMYSCLD